MAGEISPGATEVLTALDAGGNTTKADHKGNAIATTVLAETAVCSDRSRCCRKPGVGRFIDVSATNVLVGFDLGASVVLFLFWVLRHAVPGFAVGWARGADPGRGETGRWTATVRPDYARVVDICP